MRTITYASAINEALHQAMQSDDTVFQIGVGINTPWYVGNTMNGLLSTFGENRMIDPPVSENGVAGFSIGASLAGMRPILTFPRMDFMYYAMDQICNHAALLNYTFGGNSPIPLLIRAIINRKGEQGAQHSQALHGLFMHIPGLKIIMPANAYDAKGMLIAGIEDNNPVLFIEDRELYDTECDVPEQYYSCSLDKAKVVQVGSDVSIIAASYMVVEALKAANNLESKGVSVELVDLRSVKPIDVNTILKSVQKTGRVCIVDGGWKTGGLASEILSIISQSPDIILHKPPVALTLPDIPAPASQYLERVYYPDEHTIESCLLRELVN